MYNSVALDLIVTFISCSIYFAYSFDDIPPINQAAIVPINSNEFETSTQIQTTVTARQRKGDETIDTIESVQTRCAFLGTCNNDTKEHRYSITCCRGGQPEAFLGTLSNENEIVTNFTQRSLGLFSEQSDNCYRFDGTYNVNLTKLKQADANTNGRIDIGNFDRNCRPFYRPCMNGGDRRFAINLRCACPDPFFGDVCQYTCDRGERKRDSDDNDYCHCRPLYVGRECREHLCENGGRPTGIICWCPSPYHGRYCQSMLTTATEGTVISLVLVVTLLSAMYCMLRRRLNANARRPNIIDELIYSHARRLRPRSQQLHYSDAMALAAERQLQTGNLAPPVYGNVVDDTRLPPLPTYEDAIKQPVPQELHVPMLLSMRYLPNDTIELPQYSPRVDDNSQSSSRHTNTVNVDSGAPSPHPPSNSTSICTISTNAD